METSPHRSKERASQKLSLHCGPKAILLGGTASLSYDVYDPRNTLVIYQNECLMLGTKGHQRLARAHRVRLREVTRENTFWLNTGVNC